MPVHVSVIVATYNPGALVDSMIASVQSQSMDPAEVELIIVDDGSTDGSAQRLRRMAQTTAGMRFAEIAHSGWPGRPRNLGVDLAQGDYVLFMDHDDDLYPRALEQMHAYAVKHNSDIVVGKEVRTGARTMGLDTFRRNMPRADLVADGVLDIPTPHKLFRRAFLQEHRIRFAEGRRRIEDHQLLADARRASPVISVLADQPCYRWITRKDSISQTLPEPRLYYQCLRDVLDLVDQWPIDDIARDQAYLHWFHSTVLSRFGPGGFRTWPADVQPDFFAEARAITMERFPTRLDAMLPSAFRVRAALLRAGDMPRLIDYSAGEGKVTTKPRLIAASWSGHRLSLSVTALLETAERPVLFHRFGAAVLQDPSASLPPGMQEFALDVTSALPQSRADIMVTHRETNAEWFLPGESSVRLVPQGDAEGLRADVYASLDPDRVLLGSPLGPGIWDVRLRLTTLGYDSRTTVRLEQDQLPRELSLADGLIKPYRTKRGRLALNRRP